MKSIYRKIALVTGASSGIGKATATLLAKKGYDLIVTGRREAKLLALEQKLERKYAVKVKVLAFDIQDPKAVKKALNSLKDSWKKVDVLINNAGNAVGLDSIEEGSLDDWNIMIDTNIKGLLYVSKIVANWMVKNKSGHILNVCSTAGHQVYAKGNVYCASKHAVNALSQGMRIDLNQHGIKVSQVSPGHVEETEFAEVRFHGNKKKAKIYEDFNPATAKDIANVLYFIITQPRHIMIHDILVTGTQQPSGTIVNRSGRA